MINPPQKLITFAPREAVVTIPERLELEYMLDQRRLMRSLQWFTVANLGKFTSDRQDSPGLQRFLQMSAPEILDEKKLRRRLRHLAATLSTQKLAELRSLLGRGVAAPSPGLVDEWINSQVKAIQASVDAWLVTSTSKIAASTNAGVPVTEMVADLVTVSASLSARAEARASFAILQLNSQIIEEAAKGAGSTHYRWITEEDNRVRPNHVPLHGTIQGWATPPTGGGTRPGDIGHAGSGYGCRCIAEPIPGRNALNALH
jgi:SPP1 gp7 family putative phage head morphogenesis protein